MAHHNDSHTSGRLAADTWKGIANEVQLYYDRRNLPQRLLDAG